MVSCFIKPLCAVFVVILLGSNVLLASEESRNLPELIKQVLPSVVKIKIQRSENNDDETELLAFDGGGSGFVFDTRHHILTNAHVIKDARKIIVIDQHHIEYPAALVGADEKTDIAVLDVPTLDAPVLTYGKSSDIMIGEDIFVIGSPYSLSHSVTAGIVSMTERFLSNYPYIPFIQTDAAINPGNSGGPMFNMRGELIAMASTYYSKQGAYTNIGFAIPSDEFIRVGKSLVDNKKITRGYLGAELFYSEKISRKIGYPNGLYVSRVIPDSPAAIAGIKTGDLIIALNDQPFKSGGILYRYLEGSTPNTDILLSLIRNKKPLTMSVHLTALSDGEEKYVSNAGTDDVAEKMGLILSEKKGELVVLAIYAGARNVGIDIGDRIINVNGDNLNTIKELNLQLAKIKENELIYITIERGTEKISVPFGSKTSLKGNSTID